MQVMPCAASVLGQHGGTRFLDMRSNLVVQVHALMVHSIHPFFLCGLAHDDLERQLS